MLHIQGVFKSYNDHEVLKGVDLHLKNNEIKALIGVNGSGKSTLIEIICGVKKMDKGTVMISDIDIKDKKKSKKIKNLIGYMPQNFGLFSDLTVRENLEYMCAIYKLDKSRVDEILDICKLKEQEKKIASSLSGGYKQLLSCACALIHRPKLLILDEPTSAMDPIFRKNFWKVINFTKKWGASTLIITHFLEELLECDSFACLSNGIIKHDGKVSEFKKDGFVNIEAILKKYEKEESNAVN